MRAYGAYIQFIMAKPPAKARGRVSRNCPAEGNQVDIDTYPLVHVFLPGASTLLDFRSASNQLDATQLGISG
jgi:hypothetical protein